MLFLPEVFCICSISSVFQQKLFKFRVLPGGPGGRFRRRNCITVNQAMQVRKGGMINIPTKTPILRVALSFPVSLLFSEDRDSGLITRYGKHHAFMTFDGACQ